MRVPQTAILEFQELWRTFDPHGTYFISAHYLPILLTRLLPPLGLQGVISGDPTKVGGGLVAGGGGSGATTAALAALRRLERAWLPVREGQVHFQETLFALARCEVGKPLPERVLRSQLDKQARASLKLGPLKDAPVEWNAHEYFAAEMLQRTYRGFRAREALYSHKQREIKRERVQQAFRISSTLLTSFVAADADDIHGGMAE